MGILEPLVDVFNGEAGISPGVVNENVAEGIEKDEPRNRRDFKVSESTVTTG